MDYNLYLKFLVNDFAFSFVIILVSFILGWFLYRYVILKKVNLHDALFVKDNLASWVEFIGAFIFPTLYLGAKAVEGPASASIALDLAICTGYVAMYIVLFTALRLCSGLVVKALKVKDSEGSIELNSEIYKQKNVAAALFSVALSTLFVSVISFLDIMPGFFVASVYKMLTVLLFSLAAVAVYIIVLRGKTALFKEIFIDNNAAAAVGFLGFMFAVQTILTNVVTIFNNGEFEFYGMVLTSVICLAVFGILSAFFKVLFCKLVKADIWKEVYEQNNIGAAIGQAALYIGIANVIIHFMK